MSRKREKGGGLACRVVLQTEMHVTIEPITMTLLIIMPVRQVSR